MSWRVFVTRPIPEPGLSMLREKCEVELRETNRIPTKDEVLAGVEGKDALLCLLTDPVDAEVMDKSGRQLRVISNYAVGYDNIDVKAATERGIVVTNTPGVLTETTADLAWALLMSAARRIVEADRYMRGGHYHGWDPMLLLGYDIHGKTLGIIGFGRIGRAVARRAKGFNMRVLYYDVIRQPEEVEQELNATYTDIETILRESDFISLHTPLTRETHHLLDASAFKKMKKTAILINTSRGPVIDENALVEALRSGEIAYAGLDVFENEPDMAPGLADLDNVVLAPHIGSASHTTRAKMAEMAARNLLDVLEGRKPQNIVNPEVWEKRRT